MANAWHENVVFSFYTKKFDLQILTPQQIDELTSILEPIKDLQSAVLELNDALRLDVPEIDTAKSKFDC